MIALDASVLIAWLDPRDALHARALDVLEANQDHVFAVHVVNRAEALVGPLTAGRGAIADGQIQAVVARTVPLLAEDVLPLAQVRADTGLRLPDACVVLAALRLGATIATFDDRLHRAAEGLGVPVL